MITPQTVYEIINQRAPFRTQEAWDNSGLLVDAKNTPITKILLALDVTAAVVQEAKTLGAQLVVAHHPVIFEPLRSLTYKSPVFMLIQAGIGAICAHTNLDLAQGGVNDALAHCLGLREVTPLSPPNANGLSLGRIGNAAPAQNVQNTLRHIQKALGCACVRCTAGNAQAAVQRIAVCGGAGGGLVQCAAQQGAQMLVTADIKHNQMLDACALGLFLVDAGHYATERTVLFPLAQWLRESLPTVEVLISMRESDPLPDALESMTQRS